LGKAKAIKEKLKERDVEKNGSPGSTSTAGSLANGSGANGYVGPPLPATSSSVLTISTTRPSTSRQVSGPDAGSLGSIADRMRLLSGKGMNVEPSPKRFSKEMSPAPPRSFHSDAPQSSRQPQVTNQSDVDHNNKATTGASNSTGGAGTSGVARLVGQQDKERPDGPNGPRSRSGSSASVSNKQKSTAPPSLPTHPVSATTISANPSTSTVIESQTSKVQQPSTGQSSRSRRSTDASLSAPPHHHTNGASQTISPTHSGNASQPAPSPKPSRSYLPSVPSNPVTSGPVSSSTPVPAPTAAKAPPANLPRPDPPVKTLSADNLHEFEKAFPSLSEFSKQYDEPPADFAAFERDSDSNKDMSGMPNVRSSEPKHPVESWRQAIQEDDEEISFPDVAGLPDLPSMPSVPRSKPSLPIPPTKPDELRGAIGPPSPDAHLDLKRPVSTPNVATLNESPKEQDRAPLPPPGRSPLGPRPPLHGGTANGSAATTNPPAHSVSPAISFPVPQPTAGPSKEKSKDLVKPNFPLSSSIDCDSLRSYFLNPAVDVLLLDVRPEEEFQKGYAGVEYEQRGAKINIVWLDPTVVLRDG